MRCCRPVTMATPMSQAAGMGDDRDQEFHTFPCRNCSIGELDLWALPGPLAANLQPQHCSLTHGCAHGLQSSTLPPAMLPTPSCDPLPSPPITSLPPHPSFASLAWHNTAGTPRLRLRVKGEMTVAPLPRRCEGSHGLRVLHLVPDLAVQLEHPPRNPVGSEQLGLPLTPFRGRGDAAEAGRDTVAITSPCKGRPRKEARRGPSGILSPRPKAGRLAPHC